MNCNKFTKLRTSPLETRERMPEWFKVKYNKDQVDDMSALLTDLKLNTVCKAANCPNMGECFKKKTATFMILGNICTRKCGFCNVPFGKPETIDENEPENLAEAVSRLNLRHVVITQVTRDDLKDGGAEHFANTIRAIRRKSLTCTIEVLISDLKGCEESISKVVKARPDVINHNLETVPSLYPVVRAEANYKRSLRVLEFAKELNPKIRTKTGIMLGLGEKDEEIYKLMDDALESNIDFLTLGQYLRPSMQNIKMVEYVKPEKFEDLRKIALEKGFKFCASSPLVRSSYKAQDALDAVKGI